MKPLFKAAAAVVLGAAVILPFALQDSDAPAPATDQQDDYNSTNPHDRPDGMTPQDYTRQYEAAQQERAREQAAAQAAIPACEMLETAAQITSCYEQTTQGIDAANEVLMTAILRAAPETRAALNTALTEAQNSAACTESSVPFLVVESGEGVADAALRAQFSTVLTEESACVAAFADALAAQGPDFAAAETALRAEADKRAALAQRLATPTVN